MKIRTDFVTNSSSSSYILDESYNINNVLDLLKRIAKILLNIKKVPKH